MSVAEYARVGTFTVTRRQTIVVDHVCRWPISRSKDFAVLSVVLYNLHSISKAFLSQCDVWANQRLLLLLHHHPENFR